MLYDNPQLARLYLYARQVTGNEFFRTITEEVLYYVVREMLDPAGGFYSTQDADSEGEEGKFFVWTPDEIREVLGDEAEAFMAAYGVTRHGNASTSSAHGFEGRNILGFVGDMDQRPTLAEARRKLFEAREKRIHPGRDDVQLALAPTAKQCLWHCQGTYVLERPDAGCLCRSGPCAGPKWLQALAYALSQPREIAVAEGSKAREGQSRSLRLRRARSRARLCLPGTGHRCTGVEAEPGEARPAVRDGDSSALPPSMCP
jgi:hypothetical protein